VYAEVSSLKTSAIALHAVVFGFHEAPCRTGRSSKGQLELFFLQLFLARNSQKSPERLINFGHCRATE
jgi:hypothetical protein